MKFALGQKLGMTRIFDETGRAFAVTIIKSLKCNIKDIKTEKKDGYSAIAIEAKEKRGEKDRILKTCEFRTKSTESYKKGKTITFEQFEKDEKITVSGVSKGKGFAGTIKRYDFCRGPASHGGNNVREPGSIGAQQPQRVVPGRRMAGHMGAETITVRNLRIADLDGDVMLVAGAVPGNNKSYIKIYSNAEVAEVVEEVAEETTVVEPEVEISDDVVEVAEETVLPAEETEVATEDEIKEEK